MKLLKNYKSPENYLLLKTSSSGFSITTLEKLFYIINVKEKIIL